MTRLRSPDLRRRTYALLAPCVLALAAVLPACSLDQTRPRESVPEFDGNRNVEAEWSQLLTEDLTVDIHLWLSGTLETPRDRRPVRVVHAVADYNVNHLWIRKAIVSGPFDAESAEAIDLGNSGVDVGLARHMAGQILGLEAAHPHARDVTAPCTVLIRPRPGLTWGEVASEEDLEVTVRMSA